MNPITSKAFSQVFMWNELECYFELCRMNKVLSFELGAGMEANLHSQLHELNGSIIKQMEESIFSDIDDQIILRFGYIGVGQRGVLLHGIDPIYHLPEMRAELLHNANEAFKFWQQSKRESKKHGDGLPDYINGQFHMLNVGTTDSLYDLWEAQHKINGFNFENRQR